MLSSLAPKNKTILLTDEHVFKHHGDSFRGWNTIVIKPGESSKIQATVDNIILQLIERQADRSFTLVGIGGGVITDITGYVAAVYMRGIRFGFIPSTLLAMVDACIGGKNGIDVGPYKNMVGIIRQPSFIIYDYTLLETLPDLEWSNGFAEIIKHACIRDASAFRLLSKYTADSIRRDRKVLKGLIERNVKLKTKVVISDEFEQGERKILNFGHTLGHAIETKYALSHGQAIAIGMVCAADFSARLLGFTGSEKLVALLQQYGLPTKLVFDPEQVMDLLQMDKKRISGELHFILLEKIGKSVILPIPLRQIGKWLQSLQASSHKDHS